MNSLDLLAQSASSVANEWNWLFWMLVAVCGAVSMAIAGVILYWVVRYHRKNEDELPEQIQGNIKFETAWTVTPLIIFLGIFGWGAKVYFDIERPPGNARNVYAIAKQWMWKFQYPNGAREINTLHVAVGEPVKTHDDFSGCDSQPLHSGLPRQAGRAAAAVHHDLVSGHEAGTLPPLLRRILRHEAFRHDRVGLRDGAARLSTLARPGWRRGLTRLHRRKSLSTSTAVPTATTSTVKADVRFCRDLYGRTVRIAGGETVLADETYLRESILNPRAKIVEGYEPAMPSFEGQLSEEQIVALIAYIKAIGPQPGNRQATSPGTVPTNYGTHPGIAGPDATSISGTRPRSR